MNKPARSLWRWPDTALVAGAFVAPLLSMIWAFAAYDAFVIGRGFNPITLDWTAWASLGFVVSCCKVALLWGDQQALITLGRPEREMIGGLWTLANAVGCAFVFLAWALVGFLAGQLPPNPAPPRVEGGIPLAFVTGGAFLAAEGVLLGVVTLGLICRRRLAE